MNNIENIYYEIAFYLNKQLYDDDCIPYDIYLKTEKILLKKLKIKNESF